MTAEELLDLIAGDYAVLQTGVVFTGDPNLGQYFPPAGSLRTVRKAKDINGNLIAKFMVQLPMNSSSDERALKEQIERAEYRVTANNSLFCDRIKVAIGHVTDEIHVGLHQQGADAGKKAKELVHRVEFFDPAGNLLGHGVWICPRRELQ